MKFTIGSFIEGLIVLSVLSILVISVQVNLVIAGSETEIFPKVFGLAFGDAEFIPSTVSIGEYSTANTLVRVYPIGFTVGKYRVELDGFQMYRPRNIDGNVPGYQIIQWRVGEGRYFNDNVWYWESHEIAADFNTFWLDYKTGSPYPQTATTKVGFYGALGFNIYDNPGSADLVILPNPGGPR